MCVGLITEVTYVTIKKLPARYVRVLAKQHSISACHTRPGGTRFSSVRWQVVNTAAARQLNEHWHWTHCASPVYSIIIIIISIIIIIDYSLFTSCNKHSFLLYVIPDITYNVCGGMLNLTQPQPRSPVFANFDPICLLRRLQSVLNAGARLIFQLRCSDHITDALVSLHWVGCISQLEERRSLAGELTLSCTRPSEDG